MADQPSLKEGGQHAPLDEGGGKAVPLDVGGEQGEGGGLPGSEAPDGGIGLGGAAGIGPGLPVAPADSAMMAVLQQLLMSKYAIARSDHTSWKHPGPPAPAGATSAAAAAAAAATSASSAGSRTSPGRYRRRPVSPVGWRRHGGSAAASAARRLPALFHDESRVPRNKKQWIKQQIVRDSAPARDRTARWECDSRRSTVQQQARPLVPSTFACPTHQPFRPLPPYAHTWIPIIIVRKLVQPSLAQTTPPPSAPRRVVHARGPLWSADAGGRADDVLSSNSMVHSHVRTNTARQFTS